MPTNSPRIVKKFRRYPPPFFTSSGGATRAINSAEKGSKIGRRVEWLQASPVNKAAKSTGFLTSNLELARVPLYPSGDATIFMPVALRYKHFSTQEEDPRERGAIIKFIPPAPSRWKEKKGRGRKGGKKHVLPRLRTHPSRASINMLSARSEV